jgi:hypothetical protein
MLHYSLKVPLPDGKAWHKYFEDAGTNIPPPPPGTDPVSERLLEELIDARDHNPPTGHVFNTAYFQAEF